MRTHIEFYSTTGEKLRVVYQTAVPNITVAIDSARELLPSEILTADSTDYLLGGSLTLRNGRIDKYQFERATARRHIQATPARTTSRSTTTTVTILAASAR